MPSLPGMGLRSSLVFPDFQIRAVDCGEIAAGRRAIILRIAFDLPELFDLVLKISQACFRRLRFSIVLNHR